VLKVCHASPVVCQSFGFGSSGAGIYLFLTFFALGLLTLLLLVGLAQLYFTGRVPRILLIAQDP
jgi:hypothetical protein